MQKHEDLSELCIKRHSTSSLPSGYTYCNSHNVLWEEGTTVWCKSVWTPHLWKCDVREILSSLPHPHTKLAQIIKGRDDMAEINSLISSWHFIIDNTSREHLTKTSKLNKPKAVALTVQAWRHTNLHSMLCKRKGISEEVLLVWNQGLNYCIFFFTSTSRNQLQNLEGRERTITRWVGNWILDPFASLDLGKD